MCPCICCLFKKLDIPELERGKLRTGEQMKQIYDEYDVYYENTERLVLQGRRRAAQLKIEQRFSLLDIRFLNKRVGVIS